MVSFEASNSGRSISQNESKTSTSNKGTSFKESRVPSLGKQKFINAYGKQKWHHDSPLICTTATKDQGWPSHDQCNPTHTQPNPNDDMPTNVTSVGVVACCTGTRVRIAPYPTNVATPSPQGDVSYPTTTVGIIRLWNTPKPTPTKGTIKGKSSVASMSEGIRLNNGNGPDTFGRDSPVRWMGHWSDGIGAAGSATEAEMERHAGKGAPFTEDSRLNFPSQTGSQPWMGGDDTILTPFSLSPTTDTAVDSLPTLFLAYCTIAESDNMVSIDGQVTPRSSASDPVPLLTD
jgi:hypothetical protein